MYLSINKMASEQFHCGQIIWLSCLMSSGSFHLTGILLICLKYRTDRENLIRRNIHEN